MHRWIIQFALAAVLAAGTASAQSDFPLGFIGSVGAEPARATVGTTVTVSGEGFERLETLDLVWQTYDMHWDLGEADGMYDGVFRGIEAESTEWPMATVETDVHGAFVTEIVLPEDFGGPHNLFVRRGETNLNRVGIEIVPDLTLAADQGPPGSDIEITVTGLNSGQPMVWYQLTYDHAITGFLSAVTTRGTATAVIPATGRPGPHLIRLEDSPFGQPYLALDTSPWDFLEVEPVVFTVTDEPFVQPPPMAEQVLPSVAGVEPEGDGMAMWADPMRAPVGAEAVLHGRGFDPGSTVELLLTGMVGSRVTESGFSAVTTPFGTVEVDADGRFELGYEVPDTHGWDHRILAREPGATADLTRTAIQILPIAFELASQQVRFGDVLRFHLKGIGWTQTENIFGVVIDNVYVGYACGFSTNGDVDFPLTAAFAPGWHVVDLYPSFYRNNSYSEIDETPFLFRHAMLTWGDHPSGFHFRFAFEVVEDEVSTATAAP